MTSRKTLLLVGGTSDIGRAAALCYAQAGWNVQLAARNEEGARRNADDIAARTATTPTTHRLDILESDSLENFISSLPQLPDTVICVVGALGDQVRGQSDPSHASLVLRTNFEGPALFLGILAERFLQRGSGTIVGVSSVAGD